MNDADKLKYIQELLDKPFDGWTGMTPMLQDSADLIIRGYSPAEQVKITGLSLSTVVDRGKRVAKILGIPQRKVPNLVLAQIRDLVSDER